MFEFLRTDLFLGCIAIGIVGIILLVVINMVRITTVKKKYENFMRKIGNGRNIQESIEEYMNQIDEVKKENEKLRNHNKQLEENLSECIQKIGLIRYNAFKDTGSDLSFALALLNEKNTGVVLNGIYSRETSNIYSKPIQNGVSKYTLSEEEKEALAIAMK